MRRTLLLALVLAAAEIAAIATPLVASPLRGILGVAGIGTLMVTIMIAFGLWFRRSRVVSVAIATAIVAAWVAFRAVVVHDPDVMRVALAIHGFELALIALLLLMTWLHRRGWIVDSPVRRRLVFAGIMTAAVLYFVGAPSEPWNTRARMAAQSLALAAMFWPARRARARLPSNA